MKMIFILTEKQQKNVKEIMAKSYLEYRDVLDNHLLDHWETKSGKVVMGYTHDITGSARIWLEGIGFVKVNKNNIPDISICFRIGKLFVEGERDVITSPEIKNKVSKILGHSWMIDQPVVEGEDIGIKLFWWETLDHYYEHRSEWKEYYCWALPRFNPELGIKSFPVRFRIENICLELLRSGKESEARKLSLHVDDILKFT